MRLERSDRRAVESRAAVRMPSPQKAASPKRQPRSPPRRNPKASSSPARSSPFSQRPEAKATPLAAANTESLRLTDDAGSSSDEEPTAASTAPVTRRLLRASDASPARPPKRGRESPAAGSDSEDADAVVEVDEEEVEEAASSSSSAVQAKPKIKTGVLRSAASPERKAQRKAVISADAFFGAGGDARAAAVAVVVEDSPPRGAKPEEDDDVFVDEEDDDDEDDFQSGPAAKPAAKPEAKPEAKPAPKRVKTEAAAAEAEEGAKALQGMRVCITGVLATMSRGEAQTLVQHFGGTVSTTAGVQTDLLVFGDRLEDGRRAQEGSKYRRALESQAEQRERVEAFRAAPGSKRKAPKAPLRMLGEDDFLALLPGRGEAELLEMRGGMEGANASRRRALDMGRALADADAYAKAKKATRAASAASSSASSPPAPAGRRAPRAAPSLMWVDKYAPSSESELIGNNAAFQRLKYWLTNWDAIHPRAPPAKKTRGGPKPANPPLPAAGRPPSLNPAKQNVFARAALLSGPPGIGKSTTAHLVSKMSGRQVVELNASDKRNAKSLAAALRPVTSGIRVLTFGAPAARADAEGRHVIIMDEVDGLAGNDDRGGTRELIGIIARTRVPIICICNDRSSSKVRALVAHCLDLPFVRPRKEAIAKRVADIAVREGLGVDPAAVQVLAEAVGGDVRQVLHTMESWGRRARRAGAGQVRLSAVGMKAELSSTDKDAILRHTGFSAAEQLLAVGPGDASMTATARVRRMTELFFVDYDLVPLLLQQNYAGSLVGQRGLPAQAALDRAGFAAQAFADADVLSSRLRSQGQWSLLPAAAALNVRGAIASRGGGNMRSSFPEWFAKNSAHGKRRRLLAELGTHMAARVWGLPGRSGLVMDHLSVLRERVFRPFLAASALGAGRISDEQADVMLSNWPTADDPGMWVEDENESEMPSHRRLVRAGVAVMSEYGLSKEDAMESLCEVRLGCVADPRSDIGSKTKLAITKEYGGLRVRSQALVEEQGVTAKGRRRKLKRQAGGGADAGVDEDGHEREGAEDDEDDEQDGEEDEELDMTAFKAKSKRKQAVTAAKKRVAKRSASAGRKRK